MTVNLPSDLQNLDTGIRMGNVKGLADGISRDKYMDTQNAITASTTQTQAGGTVLRSVICRVTTAAANDAVTLGFKATPGHRFTLINDSGQNITLFPKSGDKLNDAVQDAGLVIADNTISIYVCPIIGLWFGGATTLET